MILVGTSYFLALYTCFLCIKSQISGATQRGVKVREGGAESIPEQKPEPTNPTADIIL
jgi:hypothetical protein